MFIEYPKAMYRQGAYSAVDSHDAEDAARADGWTDWHSDQAGTSAPAVVETGVVEPAQVAPESLPSEPNAAESGPSVAESPTVATKNKGGRPRKAH